MFTLRVIYKYKPSIQTLVEKFNAAVFEDELKCREMFKPKELFPFWPIKISVSMQAANLKILKKNTRSQVEIYRLTPR